MKAYEKHWQLLLDHLDREGLLPIQLNRSTPAEIAHHVGVRTGDDRVSTFVWAYLYPRQYGSRKGTITEKQAKAIVASFDFSDKPIPATPTIVPPERFATIPNSPIRAKCSVCQKRWAIAEEVTP